MSEDKITLRVPAKPEYVLVVRLTTSAVASRVGYNVDEIEDIKVAVAEAGIAIINQGVAVNELEMEYQLIENEGLRISITACGVNQELLCTAEAENSELSLYIIESLMDEMETNTERDVILGVTMYKKLGGLMANE